MIKRLIWIHWIDFETCLFYIKGAWQLQWHGVDVVDVLVQTQGLSKPNQLATFFIKHKFPLEPGVDRSVKKGIEKADVCAVHMDHAPFQFQIIIVRNLIKFFQWSGVSAVLISLFYFSIKGQEKMCQK